MRGRFVWFSWKNRKKSLWFVVDFEYLKLSARVGKSRIFSSLAVALPLVCLEIPCWKSYHFPSIRQFGVVPPINFQHYTTLLTVKPQVATAAAAALLRHRPSRRTAYRP